MLSDDELDRMLRAGDPGPGGSATDPDSPTAARILARVRRSARQRRRRILVLAPAVALTVAGVTAGTYAWVAGDGKGHTLDSTGLTCDGPHQGDAVVNFDPGTDDPVRKCRQQWQEMFGEPAPGTLTACVDSSQQGSIVVYAGGRDQCGRHRADPYLGPTREQLGLSSAPTSRHTSPSAPVSPTPSSGRWSANSWPSTTSPAGRAATSRPPTRNRKEPARRSATTTNRKRRSGSATTKPATPSLGRRPAAMLDPSIPCTAKGVTRGAPRRSRCAGSFSLHDPCRRSRPLPTVSSQSVDTYRHHISTPRQPREVLAW